MQFERAEMAGVQCGLQQAFAFGEIGENGAGLILAAPPPDRGTDDADQRGRMKRAFDEGDIAEHPPQPRGVRIALRAAALMRQQHERKVGPGWLTVEPGDEAAQIRSLDRLVGDDGGTGAALDLMYQRGKIAADIGVITRLLDQRSGDGGIASGRREDNGTLGRWAGSHSPSSCNSGWPSPR